MKIFFLMILCLLIFSCCEKPDNGMLEDMRYKSGKVLSFEEIYYLKSRGALYKTYSNGTIEIAVSNPYSDWKADKWIFKIDSSGKLLEFMSVGH